MNFIYFIDLTEPLVCFNFINTNQLSSPTIAHYDTFKSEYPIFTVNPEELLTGSKQNEIGFVSPRYKFIIISSLSNKGVRMGEGVENTRFYTELELERIHRIARLEIEFEKLRRKINSNLPSRLACIFVAEDNFEGRTMLQNMFYYKKKFHIASVGLSPIRLHRADSKWISDYEETNNPLSIEKYWQGIDFDHYPQYEYLVDGIIKLKNDEDRKIITSEFDITPYYHKQFDQGEE